MVDNNSPNVLDMVREFAAETGTAEADIFKRDIPRAESPVPTPPHEDEPVYRPLTAEEALAALDDNNFDGALSNPTYDVSDITTGSGKGVIDQTDEEIKEEGIEKLDELHRIQRNLELSKRRIGIKHLNIPTVYTSRIIDCAADSDTKAAGESLDAMLSELIEMFPDAVVEWLPNHNQTEVDDSGATETTAITDDPQAADGGVSAVVEENSSTDLNIIIDKRQVEQISFSEEEVNKIKRSRSIELTIVEDQALRYVVSNDKVDDIDVVLSQYTRKFNDREVSLPASRYRCTLTGLSYPEVLDVNYALRTNSLDNERLKWSIAYKHVKNPSIGPFADYDDFLQKTSSRDIEFLIWGILCATSMSQEVVSIECHQNNCNTNHDWIYSPEALLQMDKIPTFLLDEMKVTGEVATTAGIMANYNGSMLRYGNTIELPSSHFVLGFGHISAYSYLNDGIYAAIKAAAESSSPRLSELIECECMAIVKYMLLPKLGGTDYYRITDQAQLRRIIHDLDEMDFQTLNEVQTMMDEPYHLKFCIKDTVCPKCKHRATIDIPNISELLFIVAQSLETAKIVLKR